MQRIPTLAAFFAATLLIHLPSHAASGAMRPGLWEITSKLQPGNSQASAAMAEAQRQLAAMPPEQRKLIEGMMAKQGVGVSLGGDGSVRVTHCVTKEMAQRGDIPLGQQGQCSTSATPAAGGVRVTFSCANPPSSGTGLVTFQGDSAYTTTMNVTSTARGKPESMTVDAAGRWLGAQCTPAAAGQ
jgi:hypothetical protein